jgi:hypothetical protein
MKYTVVWVPSALNDLADIWNKAADRKAVTDAANRIDRTLKYDAERQGHEFNGERALFELPLAVTFTVSPDDRMVHVLQVRRATP